MKKLLLLLTSVGSIGTLFGATLSPLEGLKKLSSLHGACQRQDQGLTLLWLSGGLKGLDNLPSAHTACQKGLKGLALLHLSSGIHVDDRDIFGQSLLHYATEEGHLPVINTLLDNGANPNIINNNTLTPLHQTAWSDHQNNCAQILISYGSDSNQCFGISLDPQDGFDDFMRAYLLQEGLDKGPQGALYLTSENNNELKQTLEEDGAVIFTDE